MDVYMLQRKDQPDFARYFASEADMLAYIDHPTLKEGPPIPWTYQTITYSKRGMARVLNRLHEEENEPRE